ncbi:MAG TPA: amidase family protein [Caulobacteraceae bacterium]
MAADEILDLDATGQLKALAGKKVSSVELLEAAIARHDLERRRLNAVVTTDTPGALKEARRIDAARAKGQTLGPLAGLPMTIKDTFDVAGMPASAGLKKFLGREVGDADMVMRARGAGAVIWGKTNVPVMAGDYQTYNALYGQTNNPWNPERTPGGSSGGAAAAVACGVTALEIGSDIGGSLRTPASFCGIFSHKPTWERLSQRGHVPPPPDIHITPDLNVVGPIARSARDLRLLFGILDGTGPGKTRPVPVKGLKVGLWTDDPFFALDSEVKTAVEGFAQRLEGAGAVVTPIVPVNSRMLFDAYITLLLSLIGADLPASFRTGMALGRPFARLARELGAGPLSWAAASLAYTASHRDWLAADAVRGALGLEMAKLFESFDVVLAPVNTVAAFHHDHKPILSRKLRLSGGGHVPYTANLEWISLATALKLPATAVPAGATSVGLPVGAQLIGPYGADERVIAIAEGIEKALGPLFKPPPAATGL